MEQLFNELNFTHWMWFIAALLFLGLEALAPGVVFLWLGIAAVVSGGVVFFMPDMTWEAQSVLFVILSVISVFSGRYYLSKKGGIETDQSHLNRRGDALVGKNVVVSIAIKNGKGKVKVGDTLWSASGPDADEGVEVHITKVDGTLLIVEPIN
ncbi:MAG: NfeD family protein [Sphingomonadales bacterium]|nr:NfeD family protein [Sphingomonadales bacterium]